MSLNICYIYNIEIIPSIIPDLLHHHFPLDVWWEFESQWWGKHQKNLCLDGSVCSRWSVFWGDLCTCLSLCCSVGPGGQSTLTMLVYSWASFAAFPSRKVWSRPLSVCSLVWCSGTSLMWEDGRTGVRISFCGGGGGCDQVLVLVLLSLSAVQGNGGALGLFRFLPKKSFLTTLWRMFRLSKAVYLSLWSHGSVRMLLTWGEFIRLLSAYNLRQNDSSVQGFGNVPSTILILCRSLCRFRKPALMVFCR